LEKYEETKQVVHGVRPASAARQNRQQALQFFQILLIQAAIVSLLSILGLTNSLVTAYSILLGGLLYLLPNIFFVTRVLLSRHHSEPKQIVANVYMSQLGKMLLVVVLCIATFKMVQPLSPFSLFGSYILMQISGLYLQFRMNQRFLKL